MNTKGFLKIKIGFLMLAYFFLSLTGVVYVMHFQLAIGFIVLLISLIVLFGGFKIVFKENLFSSSDGKKLIGFAAVIPAIFGWSQNSFNHPYLNYFTAVGLIGLVFLALGYDQKKASNHRG